MKLKNTKGKDKMKCNCIYPIKGDDDNRCVRCGGVVPSKEYKAICILLVLVLITILILFGESIFDFIF